MQKQDTKRNAILSILKKYELQVALPEQVNAHLTARARAGNVTVAAYIHQILARHIPKDTAGDAAKRLYERIKHFEQKGDRELARQTTVTVLVGAVDLRRLSSMASARGLPVAEIVQQVLLADVALSEQGAAKATRIEVH